MKSLLIKFRAGSSLGDAEDIGGGGIEFRVSTGARHDTDWSIATCGENGERRLLGNKFHMKGGADPTLPCAF